MSRERRELRSYLNRRKVKDISEWLVQVGIKSPEELQKYCDAQLLRVDLSLYHDYFSEDASPEPKKVKEGVISSDKTWHVPAAERPLKHSSKKKPSPKRRARKKKGE